MGGKLVLTRLCHGLTPAVQLLEKLFYLHTLNDLLAAFFVVFSSLLHINMCGDYYVRYLPYSFAIIVFFFLHLLLTQCIAEETNQKYNKKWLGFNLQSQELVEHFSLNYINVYIHNNSSNTIILSRHYLFVLVCCHFWSHSSKMKCESS